MSFHTNKAVLNKAVLKTVEYHRLSGCDSCSMHKHAERNKADYEWVTVHTADDHEVPAVCSRYGTTSYRVGDQLRGFEVHIVLFGPSGLLISCLLS